MTGPIFIVGNGRSGTSVLRNTIRKTLDIPGHGEGHFHPITLALMTTTNRFFISNESKSESSHHMLHNVKVDEVRRKIHHVISEVYAEEYGGDFFIDKTPGPSGIKGIPHVQGAFPNMKIIFAKRRGIEVVRSAVKKFPHVAFEGHCEIWKESMTNWRNARPKIHRPYLEIDQNDIANNPSVVSKDIGDLLKLSETQIDTIESHLSTDRPQSSGELNTGAVSIETAGWNEDQIKIFRKICGPIMAEFGYSEDSEYLISTNSI